MPRKSEPLDQRIKRRVVVQDSGCWDWLGAKSQAGYGRITLPTGKTWGRTDWAHRVSYETFVGPIPAGLDLDHLCRNTSCVNPEHLEPVTRAENLHRVAVSRTHCAHGHEFTEENTRILPRGRRCKACERRRSNESNARKRAAAQ